MVMEDPQNTSDDSTLVNTLKIIGIGIAGVTAYRSGILKDLIGPMLELGDRFASEGTNKAGVAMSTIRKWTNLKHLDAAQIAAGVQNGNSAPELSIFRDRQHTLMYDLYRDLGDMANARSNNFQRVRQIMQHSREDLNILFDMIDKNIGAMPKHRQNFYDTDLYRDITAVKDFERIIRENNPDQTYAFTNQAMDGFLERRILTAAKADEQFRTTGYRQLTLGDVMELVTDSNGNHTFRVKPGAPIDLSKAHTKSGSNIMDSIESFIRDSGHFVTRNGKRVGPVSSGLWKDITLDSDIRINEAGKYIDYRMTWQQADAFINSLSHDFGLPVVGFNPLRTVFSMTGLDEFFAKKPFIGALRHTQFDPSLTGVAGQYSIGEWMSDTFGKEYAEKSVAVINGTAYTTTPDGKIAKIGEHLNLRNITNADRSTWINPKINAVRQMAGLNLGEPVKQSLADYEKDLAVQGIKLNTWQKFKYVGAQFLDMGYQEWKPHGQEHVMGLDNMSSVDVFTDNIIDRATKHIRVNGFEYPDYDTYLKEAHKNAGDLLFGSAFGEGFDEMLNPNGVVIRPDKFMTTKEGFKLSKAFNLLSKDPKSKEGMHELLGFVGQFGSGREFGSDNFGQFFTERTSATWSIFNSLNDQLAQSVYFLGFSSESKANVPEYAANLLMKRALPVYLATQIPGVINYLSEPFLDQRDKDGTENRDNITKLLMRDVVKPIDITAHHAMDLTGATHLFKFMQEYIPGTEQITELPGVHFAGLGQTAQERKEYIENGVDPIRKSRWWGAGNTPLTGGKIMYFRPNIYRRVEADVSFSDSKWGSRQEYYENAWFPNPVNPLAPINHFITDPNHFDYKHYHDRPYLMTAPEGQNIPFIGPIFAPTVGQILRPSHRMHQEYWRNLNVNPADEVVSAIPPDPYAYNPEKNKSSGIHLSAIGVFNGQQQKVASNTAKYSNNLYTSSYQAKSVTKRTIFDNAGISFIQRTIYPEAPSYYGQTDNPFELYQTPSGQMTIVDIPDHLNLYNVNQDLKQYSINKIIGVNTRVSISDMNGPGIPVGNDNQKIDNHFMYALGEQYNNFADVAGLRGFITQQFITGYPNTDSRIVKNSGYAYSFNNDFWEENLGGLGGNLSEITRRFVQKRNTDTEYVNPIRNTMPSWMPGSNYFTDFKHGDPYSKIDNGEERLPGQGYERLYGIKNIEDLRIGSSSIGYGKDYIIRHMLNQDYVNSTFEEETLEKGNEFHRHIETAWKEAGIAFSTEGEIKDERNGILGYYDAMVYDMSSPTGVGIVDIKTTSAKKLDEIRKKRKPLEHHRRQVNYYLWATGNTESKGYIYYIDKENPDNTYTVGFNYDDARLKDTLYNVQSARNYIRHGLRDGSIGRGELYDTLDQYRILADVAPYSQEFKDAAAKLSHEKLTPEEQKEVSEIRERVSEAKEPLRVYPYKFKTANLHTERVTVKKIINNNTFITEEYGQEHAIKFAGITVTESSEEKYPRHYPRKRRKGIEKVFHNARKAWDKGPSEKEYARRQINRLMRPGTKVEISYDADPRNKFSNDSTRSIRAVVSARGTNVNKVLLERGYAKENKDDDSPAGVNARYTRGEIAFGNAMERITHDVVGRIPFVGSKLYQVKSPYEQYRDREVYGKDFQSWNHPIRDIFIPNMVDRPIGDRALGGVKSVVVGAFMGSLFGRNKFGKFIGATIGAGIPAIGNVVYGLNSNQDREWRPKRRREQEKVNEYIDTLKYVKNMRLYGQYAQKAMTEDHFDVEQYIKSQEIGGTMSKLRQQELQNYKRQVKLDFKHRGRYNFKYGEAPDQPGMNREQVVRAINQELNTLQSDRKARRLPLNALKAIEYKTSADKTMYGYNPGDSLVNIMSALPKKDRQYFKHFMDAPEEEKAGILRIAPSYLRRALQSSWGLSVDPKPSLEQYFSQHALPDVHWIGWDENVDLETVKVKLVHQRKLDPGEFDIWPDNKKQADQVYVPIPKIDAGSDMRATQIRLQQILGEMGYENVQANYVGRSFRTNTTFTYQRDTRDDVERQINRMDF